MTSRLKKRQVAILSSVLEGATPYPWRRDQHGDLVGANGRAIYFMGADAVLVEHSPLMMEALIAIRQQAATAPGNAGNVVLLSILGLTEGVISSVERAKVSPPEIHPRRKSSRAR